MELEIAKRKATLQSLGDQLAKETDEGKTLLLTRKFRLEDDLLKVPRVDFTMVINLVKSLFALQTALLRNFYRLKISA